MKCLHSLYLLKTGADQGLIYKLTDKLLSEGFAVIYGVEKKNIADKSQFVNQVYAKMKQTGLFHNGIEDYIEKGALRIMDANEVFSYDQSFTINELVDKWTSIIKEFRKKGNYKGIITLAGGISVTTDDEQSKLVSYEQVILKAVTQSGLLQIVCCYSEESIENLHFGHLISIINSHQCAISNNEGNEIRVADSRQLYPAVMLEAISDGIEDVLGKGSGRLVMQTMKYIYKIDQDAIISNPSMFEEKLQKVLGNSYKIVLASITKRVRKVLDWKLNL